MDDHSNFDSLLHGAEPILALAPMQDVTDRRFWEIMAGYSNADLYYTEYFRVRPGSTLEPHILESVKRNPTGRAVIAQMIGNDIPSLLRTVRELQNYPIVAIDLNLGCPAPVVYRKCAGGGLLRDPQRVDAILGALREAIEIKFTVKTRLGFENEAGFDELLRIFGRHSLDLLTVHGRTVAGGYRSAVRYDLIARAAEAMPCPVLANGNIYSAQKAEQTMEVTGARGLMIGRGAIRNPWLFEQIRQHRRGEALFRPRGRDVLAYVRALYEMTAECGLPESSRVQAMKRTMNFIAHGAEPTGQFLHRVRRVSAEAEFFQICTEYLDHDDLMALEPYPLELAATDNLAGAHL